MIGRIRKIERRAIDDGTVKLPPLIKYQEELSSISAVVASVLVTCGLLDSKEFGDESGGVWDSTVVAAKLDGEDDDAATDGIDGRYVEKVLDVDESVFLGWVFSLLGILENFRRCILIFFFFFFKRERTSLLLHKN